MSQIQKIPTPKAIPLWNNFTKKLLEPPPFSFNPCLFNFYKKHFNWKPYYFMLTNNDEVCAILPLVYTGKSWVSLPHFSYGGMLLEENSTPQLTSNIFNILITSITTTKLAPAFYTYNINNESHFPLPRGPGGGSPPKSDLRVSPLPLSRGPGGGSSPKQDILGNPLPLPRGPGGGSFPIRKDIRPGLLIRTLTKTNTNSTKTEKVTSILKLPSNKDDLLTMLSHNLKRKINKAKKSEITIKSGRLELLDDFYSIYSRNIHKLNSLNYGKGFIKDLFSTYEYGDIKIFVAYLNNSPIGSSLLAGYNGFYENIFFATSIKARKYYISDLLHWEMIKFSIDNNNNAPHSATNGVYSFGRSTINSGVHKYKSHWPITDHPIYHSSNMPNIRKQSWLQYIWRVIPYPISSPLGAKLIIHIY